MFLRGLITLFATVLVAQSHAQHLYPKALNYHSFSTVQKADAPQLAAKATEDEKKHPEFGTVPYGTQCNNCFEQISGRTEFSRKFTDIAKNNHTYVQQSYFPLHYRDEQNRWRTIDPRMRPIEPQNGLYAALRQPLPVFADFKKGFTAIDLKSGSLVWNQNLKLYYAEDEFSVNTTPLAANYSNYTIGDDAARVFNAFPGVDMEYIFGTARLKTDFVLNQRPQFPITKGFLVIEDHVRIPEHYTLEFTNDGSRFSGWDLEVKNQSGMPVALLEHIACRDAANIALTGRYIIEREQGGYKVKMLVPLSWLNHPETQYPVVIDPLVLVYGSTTIGAFINGTGNQANNAFTSLSLGSCNYQMTVNVPGKSQLLRTLFDIEDQTTSNPNCGVPLGNPGHICLKREILHTLVSDSCNVSIGPFRCSGASSFAPNNCDTPGILTTNPAIVPGAGPIPLTTPGFLGCYEPQCPDYFVRFTLQNQDSSCGDQCGLLCARNNMWRMTIEACEVEGTVTADKTQVCAGEPVTFTASPLCGVPPYHFQWIYNQPGGTIDTTIYGSNSITIYPEASLSMGCVIYDTCDKFWLPAEITVTVVPSPPANAGPDRFVCEGGSTTLGGNPATTPGAAISWSGQNATVESWINDRFIPNPTVFVPAGTVDSFYYVLRTSDFTCFRTDTVWVFSRPNPSPTISALGSAQICNNQSAVIQTNQAYAAYAWNTGATSASISVAQPGNYFVIATDAFGCRDTSNTVTISSINVPPLEVFPDTLIIFGDSVQLYSTYNLSASAIDTFFWGPPVQISCTDCPNPIVTPLNDQWYALTVSTQGCTLTDSALIRVILPNNFFIPNAFTPNNDGNNDQFYVFAQSGVQVLTFRVYNRWGEKVHDGAYPWNGTYKGKPAPDGVYVYTAQLGLFGEQISTSRKGSVTLIR